MNKIETIEQYREITAAAKQRNYRLTNCFFFPKDTERKIARGNLYVEEITDGFLLIEDEAGFWRCYYYFAPDATERVWKPDKDTVVEVPFSNAMNESQLLQVKQLEKLGFCLGRESGMMAVPAEKAVIPELDEDRRSLCRPAEECDAGQIGRMLREAFNPLYSFLPDESGLAEAIGSKRVFVVAEGADVCGALISSFEKNTASINQVVVDPAHRGKGYGDLLLDSYHRYYRSDAKQFQHWVDLNNVKAVSMYRKHGYEFTIRKANEYINLIGGLQK